MTIPLPVEEDPCHTDYPHSPGTLYGCFACESTCACDDSLGYSCIHCTALDLSNLHYGGGT